MEEDEDTERQELDEIARSEGGLVAVTKVLFDQDDHDLKKIYQDDRH